MTPHEFRHGGVVHAGIVTDGRVRAAAGFHRHDAIGGKRVALDQKFRILPGINIVGDDREAEVVAQPLAEPHHEHDFSGADWPSDSDAEKIHRTTMAAGNRGHQQRIFLEPNQEDVIPRILRHLALARGVRVRFRHRPAGRNDPRSVARRPFPDYDTDR
jgi:hypothetical protein